MLARHAEPTLRELARYYPVVAITGPRQSGKTTLARRCWPDKPWVSLEDPDVREQAVRDPRRFLGQFASGAIFDEVQRAPDLFSYLQTLVDLDSTPGRFVLTGSQQLDLRGRVSQSLAGRVGNLVLLPFTMDELGATHRPDALEILLWKGLYPPIHDRGIPPGLWLRDYITTYVERDVRQILQVQDLLTFQRFVRMCAARTGQILNFSALAADCGITHNTAHAWMSVLEASYLVHRLAPHYRNLGKRLVKTPKLYFWDTGLAASLLGIDRPEQLDTHAMRGPLFETWVVSELAKAALNQARELRLYFWRDATGREVDVIQERGEALHPIEIKSGQTLAADWFPPLERYLDDTGGELASLVYGGAEAAGRGRVRVVGWREVATLAG